ncbi:MAG TPA: hypothetical protein VFS08_10160 [Gemmatimonadaceae bacterium]|nr:hypothetical protein [Gemmatimonadaceae bacterium]
MTLAACVLLPACSDSPGGPDVGIPKRGVTPVRDTTALLQTGALRYTLRSGPYGYSGIVDVRFTNRTGATVYVVNCNGATALHLEKRIGDHWIPVWSPVLPACLSAPITVPPGGTHEAAILVFGGYPGGNAEPRFTVTEIPGSYRLVWDAVLSSYREDRSPFGERVGREHRVSNPFILEVEPR